MSDRKYEELPLNQLCAYLRRADAISHELEESGSKLRLAEAEDGVWPLNDFGGWAATISPATHGKPLEPGHMRVWRFSFPTDRVVLVRSVACAGTHIRVLESPRNIKSIAEMPDAATGLWLPVRPRDDFSFELRNRGDVAVPVTGIVILAYVLEGVRL